MKRLLPFVLLAALSAAAQTNFSPEIHSDDTVTFRLRALHAQNVRLHCESLPDAPMQKDINGVWTFTTPPLDPDIYTYTFDADGVRMIDPKNPFIKYNLLATVSQVEVPGPASLPWQMADVPRGELHRHFFHSAVAGDDRDFVVYTPAGYNPRAHKLYPVLYLLHGFSDDTSAWVESGRANVILDNLIAREQAVPMLVVMPLGYGTMDLLAVPDHASSAALRRRNVEKFSESLLTEVIPMVQKEYCVNIDRRFRAIAGLSLGAKESLYVGLNHLDQFAWVGAFSSGETITNAPVEIPDLDARANEQLRLLWIGCGIHDKFLAPNQQFCEWLSGKGIHYTWVEKPGTHSFRVWRRDLADFVPLLFRK